MVNTYMYCVHCEAKVRSDTKTGYCASCFHQNIDGVKSRYGAGRWASGIAKRHHWAFRGISLTDEEVQDFNSQTACGICNEPFGSDKCLDHCHATGMYRGALCRQCNAALGKLGDDLDLVISRLINYRDR